MKSASCKLKLRVLPLMYAILLMRVLVILMLVMKVLAIAIESDESTGGCNAGGDDSGD